MLSFDHGVKATERTNFQINNRIAHIDIDSTQDDINASVTCFRAEMMASRYVHSPLSCLHWVQIDPAINCHPGILQARQSIFVRAVLAIPSQHLVDVKDLSVVCEE